MLKESENRKQVQIVPESDEHGAFPLAQHLFLNFDDEHVYVRFMQIVPPVPMDGTVPDKVVGRLVATVALPVERLPGIVRAFSEIGRRYEDTTGRRLKWDIEEPAP